MIFYKATRPNGTDFRTGTVDYVRALVSKKPLPLLTAPDGEYKCCTATVYHASDVPTQTLMGNARVWPCRLFEVEGEPVAQEGRKFGFRTLTVVREIEAWRALGPQGQELISLVDRVGRLTHEEVKALPVSWNMAWDAAWGAARDAARGAACDAACDAARDAAWDATRIMARIAAWEASRNAVWGRMWGTVRDAAWDAACALVVRDLISEEDFQTLYAPWASAVRHES